MNALGLVGRDVGERREISGRLQSKMEGDIIPSPVQFPAPID